MPVGAGEEAISGKDNSGGEEREAARAMATRVKRKYGAHQFTVAAADVNVSIKTKDPQAFTKMSKAHHVIIRTDQDITFKLDLASNDSIPVDADVPFPWDITEFSDIFFSGGAVDADVRVEMA